MEPEKHGFYSLSRSRSRGFFLAGALNMMQLRNTGYSGNFVCRFMFMH
jgi:hypothetical protein